ncbi:primase-helicase family protein [Enterobacter hormaechei]|uniref:primase-helicase family protein n=1 Tax=Enterobacter hormaechei TaxID=158836 RepID=UPI003F5705F8
MIQKTTTHSATLPVEAFSLHLRSQGYALISLPGGVKLRNINTCTDHGLDSLAVHYARFSGGSWNPQWQSVVFRTLPFIAQSIFNPALPSGLSEDGTLNTYRRFSSDKAPVDILTPWFEYLVRMFPDETDRTNVCAWLAHCFQRPEERPTWHLVIPSDTGTGKGFLFQQILTPLLAGQTKHYSSYAQLTEKHNGALADNLIIVFDDPPKASRRVAESLKSIQTEPTVDIRPLYENARKVATYTRFMTFSNSPTPIEVDDNDRRHYATHFIKHQVDHDETAAFIVHLSDWLEAGGLEAIYRWFMQYDLSDFNPYRPPHSAALERMKQASVSPAESEAAVFTESHQVFSFNAFREGCPAFSRDNEATDWLSKHGYTSARLFTLTRFKDTPLTKGALWYHSDMDKGHAREWYLSKYYPQIEAA